MLRRVVVLAGLVAVGACDRVSEPVVDRPTNLTYKLEPSGDPLVPAAVLLAWDPVLSNDLEVYNIYSRRSTGADYDLRASTTSTTFHDVGEPDLYYAVTAVSANGAESDFSDEVFIDERLRLQTPSFLATTSLDAAIHVAWGDNPFLNAREFFLQYRVYSSAYDLDQNLCGAWALEGTTVAPEFLAGALVNGQPRCFAVAAESIEGWESLWTDPPRADTPRPDARNSVIFAFAADQTRSGFRFFRDANGDGIAQRSELGVVGSGSATDIDFWVFRDPATDSLFFVPERAGTGVEFYDDTAPVADLTSIDLAPNFTFRTSAIIVLPGFGYVFEMDGGDGFLRYGGLRATHVGQDYIIFDWSYQTDPGNPELHVRGGLPTAPDQAVVVVR